MTAAWVRPPLLLMMAAAAGAADPDDAPSLREQVIAMHARLSTSKPLPVLVELPGREGGEARRAQLTRDLYDRAPDVAKPLWTQLGDSITPHEGKRPVEFYSGHGDRIDGEKWITLRLDGHGFSRFTRVLRRRGVLPEIGFSPDFAEMMQAVAERLCREFSPKYAYTQSDEITLVIPPTGLVPPPRRADPRRSSSPRVESGAGKADSGGDAEESAPNDSVDTTALESSQEHYAHMYSGRVQKMGTLAASMAAAVFNVKLQQLIRRRQSTVAADNDTETGPYEGPVGLAADLFLSDDLLATFDCRVGAFDTEQEAFALILWRAYDCGVNGVQDKMHHLRSSPDARLYQGPAPRGGEIAGLASKQMRADFERIRDRGGQSKLEWLLRYNTEVHPDAAAAGLGRPPFLPLPPHQAYGTFYQSVRRRIVGVDPRTGAPAPAKLRREFVSSQGSVLARFARGELFLQDDVLEGQDAA